MAFNIFRALFSVCVYAYCLYSLTALLLFQMNFKNQTWHWAKQYQLQRLFPFAVDTVSELPSDVWHLGKNLGCILLWVLHHEIFSSVCIKKYLPASLERSLFCLGAAALLHLILWNWSNHHIGGRVFYKLADATTVCAWCASIGSFIMLVIASFFIDHFELFGLKQGLFGVTSDENATIKATYLYKLVRHPMMSSLICLFWMVPVMTLDRFIFSAAMSGFIVFGTQNEEAKYKQQFGDDYVQYCDNVPNKFFTFGCPMKSAKIQKKKD